MTTTYEFTAFAESDLVAGNLDCGDTFTMPGEATVCFAVEDDDAFLSGDNYRNENAADRRGQTASIERDGNEVGNGGQIYAEKYFWVKDDDGNSYLLIEIEQEGASGDFFTFHNAYGVPPAGAELTVGRSADVGSVRQPDYKCLDAGDKPADDVDPDCIVIEAEDMALSGFKVVDGDQASDGELVKLKSADGWGSMETSFSGDAGSYDFSIFVQDESDGQGTITVKVNGVVVGQFVLDLDNNGGGSNNGGFTEFTLEGIALQPGDELRLEADGDACEYVRVDKLVLKPDDGPATGSIAGRYFCDESGNGVDDGDAAVAGVTVTLLDSDGNALTSTTTDANGNYVFSGLDAADYRVQFDADPSGKPFVGADQGTDDTIDSDVNPITGVTSVISIAAGQNVADVDAGVLPDCFIIEAEDMDRSGFDVVGGSQASDGELVKIKSGVDEATLETTFQGPADTYVISVFAQDESDGQSEIEVFVNGALVGTVTLDNDNNGGGSNHGAFSEFKLDGVTINPGDEITLVGDRDSGELLRIDKVVLKPAEVAPSIVCLDVGEICVDENSEYAVDLSAFIKDTNIVDDGVDICQGSKPVSMTFTYSFGTTIDQVEQQDPDKANVTTFASDSDGTVFLRVVDKDGNALFEGTVVEGQTFEASNGGEKFGSETHVEIYDSEAAFNAGDGPLQAIELHTSCSQPLAIADTFGSVQLVGTTMEDGTVFGGSGNGAPDDGILYEIVGGDDADQFDIDPATGKVTFNDSPDFENPADANGDNFYDVVVRATAVADGSFVDAPLSIEVKDVGICIEENTTFVADLDLEVICPGQLEQGIDICQGSKPVSLELTYSFGTTIDQVEQQDGDKANVTTNGTDTDGVVFIRVLDKDGNALFEGTVVEGEMFLVDNGGDRFESETFFEVYNSEAAFDSGNDPLQSGEFHTSCSQPLAIGDKFGSLSLNTANMEDGSTFGGIGDIAVSDGDIAYSIEGGEDAALFQVDPDTGEVSFIDAPDFESPGDANGDNNYEVVVRATSLSDPTKFTEKPLEVEVKDVEPICVIENTSFVTDLNLQLECPVQLDDGVDICEGSKPVSLEMTYSFGTTLNQASPQDSKKANVATNAPDTDGEVFIRVFDKNGSPLYEGTVVEGEAFLIDNGGERFDSETFFEVYDDEAAFNGGDAPLQSGEFHTSCSQPLAIGDTFGSLTLNTANMEDGTTFGGFDPGIVAEGDLVYSIVGGDDAALFEVDPDTGEVGFISAPDFDNPLDVGGNNNYSVVVRAAAASDPSKFVDGPLEIEVKGDGFRDCEDPNAVNIDFEGLATGATVESQYDGISISAQRAGDGASSPNDAMVFDSNNPTGGDADLATASQGNLLIVSEDNDGADPDDNAGGGTIVFDFEHPSFVFDLKFVDTEESGTVSLYDADGALIAQLAIPVLADGEVGQLLIDTSGVSQLVIELNGSGAIDDLCYVPGVAPDNASVSGRYFCDENSNDVDDGEAGIEGAIVELLDEQGAVVATATTAADGSYTFADLAAGDYAVRFTADADGKTFVDQDQGGDDTVDSDVDAVGTTATFSLQAGENKQDVDAGVEDPGTASIAGRYFCDDNNNDIDDGEPGIPNTTVGLLDSDGNVIALTTTAADGSYSFTGLSAGDYSVQFAADADGKTFVDQDQGVDDAIDSDVDGTGQTGTISLAIGEQSVDNDAGVEDPGTASIAGRYFCDDNNNDVDDGEPGIPNTTVGLLDSDGNVIALTTTAADGSYSFTGLSAGDYSVQFAADADGKTFVDQDQGADDAIDSDVDGTGQTGTISLAIGEQSIDNDAGVEDPGTASIAGRYFCDDNNNDVDDGEPGIPNANVDLLDANGNVVASTLTAADGSYSFNGLSAGDYSVQFAADADGKTFVDQDQGADDAIDSDVDGTGQTGTITLGVGEQSTDNDAGVEDPGTASIAGRYFCDDNNNDVDDDEPGIPNANVDLLDANGNVVASTTTAADGSYSFNGLSAGDYSVQFAADAGGKTFVDQDQGADDAIDSDVDGTGQTGTITLGVGEQSTDNDAGVEDPGTASIAGRYFCDDNNNDVDDGEPGIPNANVDLLDANGNVVASTVTAADGSYSFNGLSAGDYSVQFAADADGKTFVDQDQGADDAIDSDVDGAGQTGTISLAIGEQSVDNDAGIEDTGLASISGRYFCDDNNNDVDDGEPGIPNANVDLLDADGNVIASTLTAADGSYSFNGLSAGDYSVQFAADVDGKTFVDQDQGADDAVDSDVDGAGQTGTISLGVGEQSVDNDAGVEDPGTASIAGRYFCDDNNNDVDDGEPGIPNANVDLLDADGNVVASTTTAADGSYSFAGLSAGNYSVQFAADVDGKTFVDQDQGGDDAIDSDVDGTGQTGMITLGVGEQSADNDAGVEDPGTASIAGRYFCDDNNNDVDDGEPGIPNANVDLLDADGNVVASTTTAADGSYSFAGLSAGNYSVQFAADVDGKTFVDQDQGGDDAIDSDVDGTGQTGTITLGVGEQSADNDAGVEDPGTASIAGRYFCDDNNNDVDDGEPGIPNANVDLLDADGNVVASTTTAADGSYSFAGLSAGNYSVQFAADVDGKTFVDQDQGGDDAIDSDVDGTGQTGTITLGVGEQSADNDAGVEDPGTASIAGRYFCDDNNNDVDDSEPGIPNANVDLLDADGNVVASTVTAADGSYSFNGLSAGNYSVQFAADAVGKTFVDQDQGADDTIDSDVDGTGQTGTITLGVGEQSADNDAGVEDLGTASIAGRYFCDDNNNDVDDGEPGIPNASVQLLDSDGNVVAVTTTSGDGSYSFTDLKAGNYSVQFAADVDGKTFVDQDQGGDDAIDSDVDGTGQTGTISLVVGEQSIDNDAGVEDPGTASIAGRYFCDDNNNDVDDGEPGIPNATVGLLDGDGNVVALTTTAADGSYSFNGLKAGDYSVQFAADADGKTFVDQDQGADDTIDSDVDGTGQTGTISLAVAEQSVDNDAGVEDPGTASIAGRYFCDDNNNDVDDGELGIPSATVDLLDSDGNVVATTITAADGSYSFAGLKAGDYSVQFAADVGGKTFVDQDQGGDDTIDSDVDGTGQTGIISLAVGEQSEDNDAGVEDPSTASIAGRYFCDEDDNDVDDGEPGVALIPVELLDSDGNVIATTTTAEDGSYAFNGLSAGSYAVRFGTDPTGKVFVARDVGGDDTVDSDVDPDTGTTDAIVLGVAEASDDNDAGVVDPATASLAGRFFCDENRNSVDDGEAGIEGAVVSLLSPNGTVIATATTAADGSYEFDGLKAGTYKVAFGPDPDGRAFSQRNQGEDDTVDSDVNPNTGITAGIAIGIGDVVTDVDAGADALSNIDNFDATPNFVVGNLPVPLLGGFEVQYEVNGVPATTVGYCLDYEDAIPPAGLFDPTVYDSRSDLPEGIVNQEDTMDLLNWILNQDFTGQDDGNGGGTNYSHADIQLAIWMVVDDQDPGFLQFGYTAEDVADGQEIAALAAANGEGFVPGAGDIVGLIAEPDDPNVQPIVIGIQADDLC